MATLSEQLLAQVVDPIYTSTFAIWSKLEKNLVSASNLQVILLRGQLQTVKKGSSSINQYLQTIRDLSNQLASIGSPISDTDFFYYTLDGLGPEFESFITTVSLQAEDLPFKDLSSLLRSHEIRLSSLNPDLSTATILFTARPPSPSISPQPRNSFQQHQGRGRGRGRGFGSSSHLPPHPGQPPSHPHGRPICQVCWKPGHEAIDCYNRLNMAYQGHNPSRQLAAMHITAKSPHEWLTDSGATHHVTNDASHLQHNSNYGGND